MTQENSLSNVKVDGRGKNPNSLKNLKPFPKGWKGNPDPPQKGFQLSRRIKRMLEEVSDFIPPNANPNDKVYAEQIARQILIKAACGDVGMVKELLDRVEGSTTQKVEVEGTVKISEVVMVRPEGNAATPKAIP